MHSHRAHAEQSGAARGVGTQGGARRVAHARRRLGSRDHGRSREEIAVVVSGGLLGRLGRRRVVGIALGSLLLRLA